MSQKTYFSKEELSNLLQNYDFGVIQNIKTFANGASNTNLLIETSHKKNVFRYYEKRTFDWAKSEADLLKFLYKKGYPTAAPLSNKNAKIIGRYKEKPFVIFDYIEGSHLDDPNETENKKQRKKVCEIIARLHLITENVNDFDMLSREGRSKEECLKIAKQNSLQISNDSERDKTLNIFKDALAQIDLPEILPNGICHADCNYGNFLFKDDKIVGVLDFDMACYTYLIYDLASLIYWWSGPPDQEPDFAIMRSIVTAYQKIRPLNEIEKNHVFDALKMVNMISNAWFIYDEEDFESGMRAVNRLEKIGRDRFVEECF